MSQTIIPFRIFKITNEPIELHADLLKEQDAVEFGVEFSFNGDFEKRIIGCRSTYMYRQEPDILSSLTVYCYFEIEQGFFDQSIKEGMVTIDKEFLRYLATISVGTARGIQHAKTQGTVLNNFVIPPINLMDFDFKDFVLKREK